MFFDKMVQGMILFLAKLKTRVIYLMFEFYWSKTL